MWNLNECTEKLQQHLREHKESRCLEHGFYHPELLNFPDLQQIRETTDKLSLSELWIRSGALTTSGIQGSDYLIANKVWDTLAYDAAEKDKCPLIGQMMGVWEGADLIVPIIVDGTFTPKKMVGGGKVAEQEPTFVYAPLSPVTYKLNMNIAEDLIEDNAVGLVETLVKKAGQACGKIATQLALTKLIAGADGDGTLNAGDAGSGATTYAHILKAFDGNGQDGFVSNTLIITPEAWEDTVGVTAAALPGITTMPPSSPGYDMKLQTMEVIFSIDPQMHASTDVEGAAFLACKTVVFDRFNALLTARKRWLQLEKYSDPKQDLACAIVSFRQGSVTMYDDSIYLLTET